MFCICLLALACELTKPIQCLKEQSYCSVDGKIAYQCENDIILEVECGDWTSCKGGKCVSDLLCTEGEYSSVCRGTKQYTQCSDGLINLVTCAPGLVCFSGECVPPEQAKCKESEAAQCVDAKNYIQCKGEQYETLECADESVCFEGNCTQCNPSSYTKSCESNQIRSCGPDGAFDFEPCTGDLVCHEGACKDCVPLSEATKCRGNTALHCDAEGKFVEEACTEPMICSEGKCKPPAYGDLCDHAGFGAFCYEGVAYNCAANGAIVTDKCSKECFVYNNDAVCSLTCTEGMATIYSDACTTTLIKTPGNIVWGQCVKSDDGRFMAHPVESAAVCVGNELVTCVSGAPQTAFCAGVCSNADASGVCVDGPKPGESCVEADFQAFCASKTAMRLCISGTVTQKECNTGESCTAGRCTNENFQVGDFCNETFTSQCRDNNLYRCYNSRVTQTVCDSTQHCATYKAKNKGGCGYLCEAGASSMLFSNSCTLESLAPDEIVWAPCEISDQGENIGLSISSKSACSGSTRVYCEQKVLKQDPCPESCSYTPPNAVCKAYVVGEACNQFAPYCKENSAYSCTGGKVTQKSCASSELCYKGSCQSKEAPIVGLPCDSTQYSNKCFDSYLYVCRNNAVEKLVCSTDSTCLAPKSGGDADCIRPSNACTNEGELVYFTNGCDDFLQDTDKIIFGHCLKASDDKLYRFNREAAGFCRSSTQWMYCQNKVMREQACTACTNSATGGQCTK